MSGNKKQDALNRIKTKKLEILALVPKTSLPPLYGKVDVEFNYQGLRPIHNTNTSGGHS